MFQIHGMTPNVTMNNHSGLHGVHCGDLVILGQSLVQKQHKMTMVSLDFALLSFSRPCHITEMYDSLCQRFVVHVFVSLLPHYG